MRVPEVLTRAHSSWRPRTLFLLLLLFAAGACWAQSDTVLAYRGATLHTAADAGTFQGTLVLEGDRIRAVLGATETIPDGAQVIDVTGKHIVPGLILTATNLGLVEIDSIAATDDTSEIAENNADLRVELAFHADSYRLPPTLGAGIVAGHVVPSGGLISGTSAVLRFEGWNWEDMTIKAPLALQLTFPSIAPDADPGAEDGPLAELNELLEQATTYQRARDAGVPVATSPKLERIAEVLAGQLRLMIHAPDHRQIAAALDWTEQHGIDDWILATSADATLHVEALATRQVPVLLGAVLTLPRRVDQDYDAPYVAPSVLAEAGVRFAISGAADSSFARNLAYEAAMAAAFGLGEESALRSVTLWPAEILGVSEILGSLEPGKEASFFIADGPPLEATTAVERVFVRGAEVDASEDRQIRLRDQYSSRP